MVNSLIVLEQNIQIVFFKLRELEKNNKKDSLEFNRLLYTLSILFAREKSILTSLDDIELLELINKILDINNYIPLGIQITAYSKLASKKIATRLSNLILPMVKIDDYESMLTDYLTIDELMLALSNCQKASIDLKYYLAFIVPQIGSNLLVNKFSISSGAFIISDTVKKFYNKDHKEHQEFKDQVIKKRFISLLHDLIKQYNDDLKSNLYFELLKEVLRAIYILASDDLQIELREIYYQEIEANEELKEYLGNIFEYSLENILKVTFK